MGLALTRLAPRMRAVSILAVVLYAALLLVPGNAGANSANVTVTANIAPTFSLTVLTDGDVAFGERVVGSVYTASEQQRLRVTSSRPWDFSDSSDTRLVVGAVNVPRDRVVRHAVSPTFGTNMPSGVHDITCVYTLDLTTPEALRLPASTPFTVRFGYSAVQR